MESQMSISSNEDQKEICVQSPRFQVPHTPISPISPSTLPKLPAASGKQFNVIKSIPGQSSSRSPSPTVGSDAAVSRSPRMIFDSPSLRQVDADESDHGVVDMDISPETTPSGGLMLTLGPSAPSPPSTKRTATRSPTPNEPGADDVKHSLPESGYAMMITDLDALRRRFLEAMEAAEKRSREVHEAKNLTFMEARLFDGDLSEEDDTLSEMSSPGLGMSHNRALKVSSSLFSPHTDSPCKDGKRQSSNRSTCRQILTPTSQSASPLLPARPIVFETIYSPRTIAPMRVAGSAMYPVVSQKTSDPVVGSVPHGYRTSASYSGCIRFLGEPAQQLPNADCDLTQEEDILNGNTLVALSLLDRSKKA
ncbi:hypothetical protein FRC17_002529 [Serendipita sp. 399]|nr:hypothetical protein FRC17_002529 [Serendipita sp. 399]